MIARFDNSIGLKTTSGAHLMKQMFNIHGWGGGTVLSAWLRGLV